METWGIRKIFPPFSNWSKHQKKWKILNKNYNNNLHASVKTLMQALHVYICKTKVIEIKGKLNVFSFHRIKVKRVTKTHQINTQKKKKKKMNDWLIPMKPSWTEWESWPAAMQKWLFGSEKKKKTTFVVVKEREKRKISLVNGRWELDRDAYTYIHLCTSSNMLIWGY